MRRMIVILGVAVSLVTGSAIEATAATDPVKVAKKYFDTLFTSPVFEEREGAVDLAAPGSVAERYAIHQLAVQRADRDSGSGITQATQKVKGKTVIACNPTAPGVPEDCLTYAKFRVNKRGKLASFAIDGDSIAKRVLVGGGSGTALGATVRVVSSYIAARGDLYVAMEIAAPADGAVDANASSATYQPPSGPLVQASTSLGPFEVQAGVTVTVVAVFPGQSPGGTLNLPLSRFEPDFAEGSVALETAA